MSTSVAVQNGGAEVGNLATDNQVGTLSELPAFNPHDPAMVFMAQIAHRWSMAKMLVKSGMIPQKTAEAAIAVMLKGHELGVTPMVAFANMFFFDGKLGMSADLMTALFIQKAGGRIEVIEWTDKVCRIRFTRSSWEPSIVEYTEEDAKNAGLLGKPNWKNRKAMLSARCRSMGVRLLAPDVFAGTYSTEELQDMRDDAVASLGFDQPAGNGGSRGDALRNRLLSAQREVAEVAGAGDPPPAPAVEVSRETVAEEFEALAAEDAPDGVDRVSELMDEVAGLVADMAPKGGDATDEQRKRIREHAGQIFSNADPAYAKIVALTADADFGKRQAGIVVGKLKEAVAVLGDAVPAATAAAPTTNLFGED